MIPGNIIQSIPHLLLGCGFSLKIEKDRQNRNTGNLRENDNLLEKFWKSFNFLLLSAFITAGLYKIAKNCKGHAQQKILQITMLHFSG